MQEAALRRDEIRQQFLVNWQYFSRGLSSGIFGVVSASSKKTSLLLQTRTSDVKVESFDENDAGDEANVTVSSIHESEKELEKLLYQQRYMENIVGEDQQQQNIVDNTTADPNTPWRNIPIKWKQNQRQIYQIYFQQQNPKNAMLDVSSLSTATTSQQQQPSPLKFFDNNNINAASSPSRSQRDSVIFCAARRIQRFMFLAAFVKRRERRLKREVQVFATAEGDEREPPLPLPLFMETPFTSFVTEEKNGVLSLSKAHHQNVLLPLLLPFLKNLEEFVENNNSWEKITNGKEQQQTTTLNALLFPVLPPQTLQQTITSSNENHRFVFLKSTMTKRRCCYTINACCVKI